MTAMAEREQRVQRKYNLTPEQWHILVGDRHCPGCGKPFSAARLPCVDHNHETGLVRGLLCRDCNTAVGERHDNAAWFRRIADYLDNPPALHEGIEVYVPGSIGEYRASLPG